jgi:hypothetical protein
MSSISFVYSLGLASTIMMTMAARHMEIQFKVMTRRDMSWDIAAFIETLATTAPDLIDSVSNN